LFYGDSCNNIQEQFLNFQIFKDWGYAGYFQTQPLQRSGPHAFSDMNLLLEQTLLNDEKDK